MLKWSPSNYTAMTREQKVRGEMFGEEFDPRRLHQSKKSEGTKGAPLLKCLVKS